MTVRSTPYTAKLIYHANGGSGGPLSETQTTYVPNQLCTFTISKIKPTRSNYTFLGWATSSSASTPQFSNPATTSTSSSYSFNAGNEIEPDASRTLYAIWQPSSNPYSAVLKYDANGGSGEPSSQSWSSSSPSTSHTFTIRTGTPTWTGRNFLGWAKTSSATSPQYSNPEQSGTSSSYTMTTGTSSSPTNTKKLYAVWKKKTYSIRYRTGSNGSGTEYTDTKTYGITITLRGAIFTRSGYTQDGWSTSDGGSKEYNLGASYNSNSSITLYPHWTRSGYTITYKHGTGATGSTLTQNVGYGQSATLYGSGHFQKDGCVQTGWSTSNGGPKTYDLEETYSGSSITLYPFWSSNSYTVTYKANGGTGDDYVQNVTYGEHWTTYSGSGFSRNGFELKGWATSENGSVVFSLNRLQSAWSVTYNRTLYAVWGAPSIVHIKTSSGVKNAKVYIKTSSGMKTGVVYIKGNDGNMHQNS